MAVRSSNDRRRIAEMIPTDIPTNSHTMHAPIDNEIVAGRRFRISSRTSVSFWKLCPKSSLVIRSEMYSPYCVVHGLVELVPVTDLLDQPRVGRAARAQARGVGPGRQHGEDQEGDRHDGEDEDDHPQESANDVAAHGVQFLEEGPPRVAAGPGFRSLSPT